MYVESDQRANNLVPIKVWADKGEIERGALDQIYNVASLLFAFHHIALMPDAHLGYGMPIGGVAALKGAISPNMVGVDIGCGMRALRTSLTEISKEKLIEIMSEIRKAIPVGFKHHEKSHVNAMPNIDADWSSIINREFISACKQIGTLGGGNHFIEIQRGNDGYIWIMVHSGSRNLGKQVADYYNKEAKLFNEKWHSRIDSKWDLAFLPTDDCLGTSYIKEMNYCLEFAEANRKLMMYFIYKIFTEAFKGNIRFYDCLDIHHNYAVLENHFGKNVWVHRKGAIRTREGEFGIIPGSQGTASYIVKGKGNPESFMSASHGAGRIMSRTKARAVLNINDVAKNLDQKGIIHSIRDKTDLDEAPEAYKNIDEVMANQVDLVEIVTKLEPLAVIKG